MSNVPSSFSSSTMQPEALRTSVIRATPSSLSSRVLPSIPPASQAYEPAVKAVLQKRILNKVFPLCAAASLIYSTIWVSWMTGGLSGIGVRGCFANLLRPTTLLLASITWAAGVIPISVYRKLNMSASSFPALSPQEVLRHSFSKTSSRAAFLLFVSTSIFFAFLHAALSYLVESGTQPDLRLSVWTRSKKHPYHINGRFLYVLLSQIVSACAYWIRDILRERYCIHRLGSQEKLKARIFQSLLVSFMAVLLLCTVTAFGTIFIFVCSRSIVLPAVYSLPVLHSVLRPFVAHFFRPQYTVVLLAKHVDLFIRATFMSLTTCLMWEFTQTLFDVYLALPVLVASNPKDEVAILISGIASDSHYFKLQAFHELSQLASSDAPDARQKRSTIYSDTKHKEVLWATFEALPLTVIPVSLASMPYLTKRSKLVFSAGKPPPPPVTSLEKPLTPISRRPILKTSQLSPTGALADTISSEGALTKVFEKGSGDAFGITDILGTTINPLRKIEKSFSAGDPSSWVAQIVSLTSLKLKSKAGIAKSDLRRNKLNLWWTRPRKDRSAQKSLPNKDLDCMLVAALSGLVARSFNEDTLGTVQRDVPRVLEALLSFLISLEECQEALAGEVKQVEQKSSRPASSENDVIESRDELVNAGAWIEGFQNAVLESVCLIAQSFQRGLESFNLPCRIAEKLQGKQFFTTESIPILRQSTTVHEAQNQQLSAAS